MKYYKFKWDEVRVDNHGKWGTSNWLIEINEDHYPSRQIEIYQNGKILKYDSTNFEDEYGMLGDKPFDNDSRKYMNAIEISNQEFEKNWNLINEQKDNKS